MWDPRNQNDLSRLRERMKAAAVDLNPFVTKMSEALRVYAGPHYGDSGLEDAQPVNMYRLALNIYRRALMLTIPKVKISTNNRAAKRAAFNLQIATNDALEALDIDAVMYACIQSALFRIGIVKTAFPPREYAKNGRLKPESKYPFVEAVFLPDWLHDTSAKKWSDVQWEGARSRLELEFIHNNPAFNADVRKKVQANKENDVKVDDFDIEPMTASSSLGEDELFPSADVWDIWIPNRGEVVTLTLDDGLPALRIVEWTGPPQGPYRKLGMDFIPGSIMPPSPSDSLLEMNYTINSVHTKLAAQAEDQKNIGIASGIASQDGTADAILRLRDGDVLNSNAPDAYREVSLGGIDQQNLVYVQQMRQLFSYLAGNIDLLGGLAPQAETAKQEAIMSNNSQTLIGDFQNAYWKFFKNVASDVSYYLYNDPTLEIRLNKPMGNTGFAVQSMWSPDERYEDWAEMHFNLNPYNDRPRTPDAKLQALLGFLDHVSSRFGQQMAAGGMSIDMETLFRIGADLGDMSELSELIRIVGIPMDLAPPELNSALPQETTRNYVRESQSTGPTMQAQENMLSQVSLGQGGQNNGGGAPKKQLQGIF